MSIQIDLFFQKLLTKAITTKASDLILTVGNLPTLKIDQRLQVLDEFEVVTPALLGSFLENILNEQEKQDLAAKKHLSVVKDFNEEMRFRVDVFYQRGFPSVEASYLVPTIPALADFKFPKAVEKLTALKRGLVIVGGPYSAGKTTVIASFLDHINKNQGRHIITIEQPVEYLLSSNKSIIEQREIGSDAESFLSAMKDLRELDADVVFVSQAATVDELKALIELIEGGRLVFLTMEGESVQKILEKIIDMFSIDDKDRILHSLADLLEGVIVLRLLPKVGGGLSLASEIMVANQAVAALIREGRFYQLLSVIPTSRQEGMRSLDQSLSELVMSGKVDYEDAEKESLDRNNFETLVRR